MVVRGLLGGPVWVCWCSAVKLGYGSWVKQIQSKKSEEQPSVDKTWTCAILQGSTTAPPVWGGLQRRPPAVSGGKHARTTKGTLRTIVRSLADLFFADWL